MIIYYALCIMNYELFTNFASLNKKSKKQTKNIDYGKDS